MAALGLLSILARSEALTLVVGHVDHGLRESSAEEARQVAVVAEGLGLAHAHTRLDLTPGPGLPARAREARRAALSEQARAHGAGWVVLAHSATDQAETTLMHLARGCSLEGLGAMPVVDGPWFRPLLTLTRAELRSIAGRLELPFIDDPTNDDRGALRTWLRHEVLAPLRARNPELDRAMAGLAEDARDAESALDRWAAASLAALELESAPDRDGDPGSRSRSRSRSESRAWRLKGFHELPRAVRTRVVRRLCAEGGVDLSELGRRVTLEIDAAATLVARAEAGPGGTPKPPPKYWHLHPKRVVKVSKAGICVEASN